MLRIAFLLKYQLKGWREHNKQDKNNKNIALKHDLNNKIYLIGSFLTIFLINGKITLI